MLIHLPDTDEFVDYEELLGREKDGEKFHYLYKPVKKNFEISVLLDGIPSMEKVSNKDLMLEIKKANSGIEEIKNTLDKHYQYLINLPDNEKIKDGILNAIKELNTQQSKEISEKIMEMIGTAFELHQGGNINLGFIIFYFCTCQI